MSPPRLLLIAAGSDAAWRCNDMIIICFPDAGSERKALGHLAGRFAFKTWATGQTAVPEAALASLAVHGIPFTVEGPASYELMTTYPVEVI